MRCVTREHTFHSLLCDSFSQILLALWLRSSIFLFTVVPLLCLLFKFMDLKEFTVKLCSTVLGIRLSAIVACLDLSFFLPNFNEGMWERAVIFRTHF